MCIFAWLNPSSGAAGLEPLRPGITWLYHQPRGLVPNLVQLRLRLHLRLRLTAPSPSAIGMEVKLLERMRKQCRRGPGTARCKSRAVG
ncbi:hypothetical protein GUJ93_ZPchr0013g36493 [Zizania palustris]|uniref:Uncharacterized protein n=1 Tax=Zizania palustris TaxID=103762 RepID=A0A8J6C2K8_ZIZPA|nr:hypothetical protein GUJ93_ZPchr0013g36493 [Zizania palustris]